MTSANSAVSIEGDEAELIGDIIADGFHVDPVCTWLLGEKAAAQAAALVDGVVGAKGMETCTASTESLLLRALDATAT